VAALAARGPPEGLGLAHFNALRGRDDWKGVGWLGVVSRPLPPPEALRDLAAVIDGQPADAAEEYVMGDAEWLQADNPEGAWTLKGVVPRREDPLEQELLAMIVDDELAQAVGRARLVRREGAGVQVDVLTSHPVPGLEVNELVTLDAVMDGLDAAALAAARGVVIEPGCKGYWEALAAVAGGDPGVLRKAAQRSQEKPAEAGGAPFDAPFEGGEECNFKSRSSGTSPHKGAYKGDVPLEPNYFHTRPVCFSAGRAGPEAPEAAPAEAGPGEVEREPSPVVACLLKLGTWTAGRLRLPHKRYTIPVQIRAETPAAAEALVRRFFPGGVLAPVEAPKRPRGRPPRQPSPDLDPGSRRQPPRQA
jgi:hypothetical protein